MIGSVNDTIPAIPDVNVVAAWNGQAGFIHLYTCIFSTRMWCGCHWLITWPLFHPPGRTGRSTLKWIVSNKVYMYSTSLSTHVSINLHSQIMSIKLVRLGCDTKWHWLTHLCKLREIMMETACLMQIPVQHPTETYAYDFEIWWMHREFVNWCDNSLLSQAFSKQRQVHPCRPTSTTDAWCKHEQNATKSGTWVLRVSITVSHNQANFPWLHDLWHVSTKNIYDLIIILNAKEFVIDDLLTSKSQYHVTNNCKVMSSLTLMFERAQAKSYSTSRRKDVRNSSSLVFVNCLFLSVQQSDLRVYRLLCQALRGH